MNLDFDQTYVLEDDVALLRPLEISDLAHLLPFAIDEPNLWIYSLVSAAGADGMKQYMETALDAKKKKSQFPFIVMDKRTGKYAGCTRFYDIQVQDNTLQLGYTWYGKVYQGTGLNKHCKYLLLQFAFESLGVDRVEFRADHRNDRSIAAMKSIGCVEEGTLRSHALRADGARRTSMILSILKDEWFDHVKNDLITKIGKV